LFAQPQPPVDEKDAGAPIPLQEVQRSFADQYLREAASRVLRDCSHRLTFFFEQKACCCSCRLWGFPLAAVVIFVSGVFFLFLFVFATELRFATADDVQRALREALSLLIRKLSAVPFEFALISSA